MTHQRRDPAYRIIRWLACPILVGLVALVAGMSGPLYGLPTADSTIHNSDTLMTADSLVFVDSAQPRFRIGGYLTFSASDATMKSFPLEPELTPGYTMGIRTELEFGAPLYFVFEVELIHRPLQTTLNNGRSVIDYDFNFLYLQFPLLFQTHFQFGDGPVLTPGIGAVPSVALSRTQMVSDGFRDTTIAVDSGIQTFDFGLELRLGTEWSLGERSALTVDLRYLLGLQNLLILASREDPRAWHATTMGLSLGWMYQLQRPIYRE